MIRLEVPCDFSEIWCKVYFQRDIRAIDRLITKATTLLTVGCGFFRIGRAAFSMGIELSETLAA